MLELKTGEPRWYPVAVVGIVLVLCIALITNSIEMRYSALVMAGALIIVALDWRTRKRRAHFLLLRVWGDGSLSLLDDAGDEIPFEIAGAPWVSSRIIIIPLRASTGERLHMPISRQRNDPDSFRKFTVICRFGFAVGDSERHNVAQSNRQGSIK